MKKIEARPEIRIGSERKVDPVSAKD